MKYSVFLGAAACVSVLTCKAYAQTCGAQPSCSSLGYTYTGSTSDCVNTPMKCPFNTSYFNCVKKNEMVNTIVPNYSSYRNLSANGTTYTVGSGALAS